MDNVCISNPPPLKYFHLDREPYLFLSFNFVSLLFIVYSSTALISLYTFCFRANECKHTPKYPHQGENVFYTKHNIYFMLKLIKEKFLKNSDSRIYQFSTFLIQYFWVITLFTSLFQ